MNFVKSGEVDLHYIFSRLLVLWQKRETETAEERKRDRKTNANKNNSDIII